MLINDNKIICEMKHFPDAMVEVPLNDSFFMEDFTPTYIIGDDNAPGTVFRGRTRFNECVIEFVPVKGIKPGDEIDKSLEEVINDSPSDFQLMFEKKESLRTFINYLEELYNIMD
jgi:hypothetical protein